MPCYHPLRAYRSTERNPDTGKYGITFNPHKALVERNPLFLPCSKCQGCRLQKSKQWALRSLHEFKSVGKGVFLTLTYDEQHVPTNFSVDLHETQRFMRKVRKRLRREHGPGFKVSFLAIGEYGDQMGRPHYHVLLFGFDFPDKTYYRTTSQGDRVYKSEMLSELWPYGLHEIGDITYKSAAYCARYTLKKINGPMADDYYRRVSPIDGNTYNVRPEFMTCSTKPGLGSSWFEKFKGDAFQFGDVVSSDGEVVGRKLYGDFLIVDGHKVKPPAYYLKKLPEVEVQIVQRARKRFSLSPQVKFNNTPERLKVREEVQRLKAKRLYRPV